MHIRGNKCRILLIPCSLNVNFCSELCVKWLFAIPLTKDIILALYIFEFYNGIDLILF